MGKDQYFSGQPIFSQLLSFVNWRVISKVTTEFDSDKYYKKFKTKDHFITMLYCVLHKCSSIREITTGMQACLYKLNHLGMYYCPRRSTLSDANKNRSSEVFEAIYKYLYESMKKDLPDSRKRRSWFNKLYIIDSTSISLFKEILKNGGGRTPASGKRKGGVKVHTMIKADENVPCFVRLTSGATHDVTFIKGLKLPPGSYVTFDRGYVDHTQYQLWTEENINWVTRIKPSSVYTVKRSNKIDKISYQKGVTRDEDILLGYKQRPSNKQISARLISYTDKTQDRSFQFITNNKNLKPETIASIYKHRWQIELLFKRVKQNFPLSYFIGDNENAIKIQIWVCLIADLLIKYLKAKLKRSWSFSNLVSMIRIHLMSYFHLTKFLESPDKALINNTIINNKGPTLFDK